MKKQKPGPGRKSPQPPIPRHPLEAQLLMHHYASWALCVSEGAAEPAPIEPWYSRGLTPKTR